MKARTKECVEAGGDQPLVSQPWYSGQVIVPRDSRCEGCKKRLKSVGFYEVVGPGQGRVVCERCRRK